MSEYTHHLFFCTNQRPDGHDLGCCASKGSSQLRNFMKAKIKELNIPNIRVNTAGCLGRCEDGPSVVVYPENIWYKVKNKNDVEKIIYQHIKNNKIVEELLME